MLLLVLLVVEDGRRAVVLAEVARLDPLHASEGALGGGALAPRRRVQRLQFQGLVVGAAVGAGLPENVSKTLETESRWELS